MRTSDTPNGFAVMRDLYKDHVASVVMIAASLFAATYLIAEMRVF